MPGAGDGVDWRERVVATARVDLDEEEDVDEDRWDLQVEEEEEAGKSLL